MKIKKLVSIKPLAREYLGGISERTIQNYVKRGLIPSVSIGRRRLFNPEAVIAALEAQSEK